MLKLNKITNFLDTHPIGRVFKLGKKKMVWKRVAELKPGLKIAIANSSGYNHERPEGVEWDEIVSIKKVGRERVYDIEVEGTHNFVGNGILAHNTHISLTDTGDLNISQDTNGNYDPVAEDFYSAFSVGNDPQHLATLDISGVALAGLKALITKVNTLEEKTSVVDLKVLQTLEANGAVTFKAQVEFQGLALFRGIAEFFDTIIFHKDVSILGTTTFNSDTAGFAVIPTKGDEVSVVFDKEYAAPPIVTASPLWETDQTTLDVMKQLGTYILPQQNYIIANVTMKGFTIILEQPAVIDLKFSWTATSIKDAKTLTGVAPIPEITATPEATASASPEASPEASPSASPTP